MKKYPDIVWCGNRICGTWRTVPFLCMMFVVFTAIILSVAADFWMRGQIEQVRQSEGDWHIAVFGLSQTDAALINAHPDVEDFLPCSRVHFNENSKYLLNGKNIEVFGCDQKVMTEVFDIVREGSFPCDSGEALVSENVREVYNLEIGSSVVMKGADGRKFSLTVSGFVKSGTKMQGDDSYGLFLNMEGFYILDEFLTDSSEDALPDMFYVRFRDTGNIQKSIAKIQKQFGLDSGRLFINKELVNFLDKSADSFRIRVDRVLSALSLLVMCAGLFLITVSLNNRVEKSVLYFRFLCDSGMTLRQFRHIIRVKVLRCCSVGVFSGIAAGLASSWGLIWMTSKLREGQSLGMGFDISVWGILNGTFVGVMAVFLAVCILPWRACRILSLAATAKENGPTLVKKAADTRFFRVETALGIRHALSDKKNFVWLSGEFALCILLMFNSNRIVNMIRCSLSVDDGALLYWCSLLCIYGFLGLAVMVILFNMIKRISKCVALRIKEYAVFQTVGMSRRQLRKNIITEVLIYAVTGAVAGVILSRFLCSNLLLIMSHLVHG